MKYKHKRATLFGPSRCQMHRRSTRHNNLVAPGTSSLLSFRRLQASLAR